jgi:hypothetical protein
VIAEPLSVAGGSKDTIASASPVAAVGFRGAEGIPTMIAADAMLLGPSPTLLVANTANVYEEVLSNPATVTGVEIADPRAPPGFATAVKLLIGEFPS